MARGFIGSKAASITAGVLFTLVVVAIIILVGGDSVTWDLKVFFAQLSRGAATSFPTLWEYKFYILVFGAVIAVIFFVRKMNDGPVKKL